MVDVFERIKTALARRYTVEDELGAGGMATVYAARDLQHARRVAVKVLRPELAAVLGGERFLHEIRITAGLQHPHILPLFDSGEADGFLYYVMPLVEGESLRRRLERERQLPIEDALEITQQIASALAYAHDRGVIHRDIKPENILLSAGTAMVADFGIARAVRAAGGKRLTDTGLVVGTPAYMSPEQATGASQVDARSDIYSMGCLLYEMLVGEPPFSGPTAQAITARKLTDSPPPIASVREAVPEPLEAAVRKALARVPADRFTTARQFREALVRTSVPAPTAASGFWERLRPRGPVAVPQGVAWLAVVGLVFAGVLAASVWLRPATAPPVPRALFAIPLAEADRIDGWMGNRVAVSPDGRHVAWASPHRGPSLRLRAVDGPAVSRVGPDDAFHPFFSPDGRWLGFFAGDQIAKVRLDGGTAVPVAPAPGAVRGASWQGDIIVFATGAEPGLMTVEADGGTPRVLTVPDTARGELDHRWPEVLPGGRVVLFTIWTGAPERSRVAAARLPGGEVTVLAEPGLGPKFLARTGHVVYAQSDGTLLAAPFDRRRVALTGPAVPLIDGVSVKPEGVAEFALASDGILVFFPGEARRRRALVSVDRRGIAESLLEERAYFLEPRVSPDGDRVAIVLGTPTEFGTDFDVWVYDLAADTRHRLTHGGYNRRPAWSTDGSRVLFSSGRPRVETEGDKRVLLAAAADGSGVLATILEAEGELREVEALPSGEGIVFAEDLPQHLGLAAFGGASPPRRLVATRGNDARPRVSPDGRWLAYMSDESGQYEIYVAALPGGQPRWQISRDGGTDPAWSSTGRELFYLSGGIAYGDGMLVAAELEPGAALRVRSRTPLFDASGYVQYDVHPDGERFVMITREQPEAQQIMVALHWHDRLRREAR
jgi:eukaryotic-like serine/threonine-protein kinase